MKARKYIPTELYLQIQQDPREPKQIAKQLGFSVIRINSIKRKAKK